MKRLGCFLPTFLFMCLPVLANDLTFFDGYQSPGKVTLRKVSSGTGIGIRGYSLPKVQDQTLNIFEVSLGAIIRLGD